MNKNKIIDIIFWLALLGSFLFGAYRFFIARNFVVVYETDCDPTIEKCFVWECDEALGECIGDEEEDIWYYSRVKKMAYDVADCNPNEGECADESICDQPITQKCWIEKCDESLLEEGEECSDPETYLEEHPDALEEEGDEEELGEDETLGEEGEDVNAEADAEEGAEEVSPEEVEPGEMEVSAEEIPEEEVAVPLPVSPLPSPVSSAVPN